MLQTAAENLELRERVKGVPSASKAAAVTHVYQPLQPHNNMPEDSQQIVPQSQSTHETSPAYPA